MALIVKNNISWVGKQDWELREFHGSEYSTHRGSSYNSYLIREEKTVLIDTVWTPYAEEFVANLEREVELGAIDYIIANHGEADHSGALPALMSRIPDTPIYCTENGVKSLRGHYHQDWNFQVVKTGDSLDLGNGKKLVFVEMPMLHWPDSMATYLTGDAVLFSNDAFGQHYASARMFNDQCDQAELQEECIKYYANILTPFSPLVTRKIQEVLALNLPIDMIATSHGIIWRDNPSQIVEQYLRWADDYQENQITLLYDTMWNGTRMLAEAIAEGMRRADPAVAIKLFNLANTDKNDVLTHVFRSKAILVGSPTVNNVMLPRVAALLEEMTGLRFRNKAAAAFGTHGWSGGAVDRIAERLAGAGFRVLNQGIAAEWRPTIDALSGAAAFGEAFIAQLSGAADAQGEAACGCSGMMRCKTCSWIYDPAKGESSQGVAPGTVWSDVPDSFLCPECFMGKHDFVPA
ncbi:anaerobic nitric oxide reductase flavorubredoxin [Chromobacterium phragmitis]|uniref:anaerobic nitric oxide reductase flavorubredoxin n=1 Tax=Chromobacterium phragmitis TaxID=2202141 RepID=UPI000DEC9B2B|nr:anaerobic nitric oxide reductase flavorubredoxin [Chromobacterium phragmitis]AXE31663.1 anaerobic nitric oxide reductase flavorubredoxin [Chromobacterium phragmitis]